MPCCSCFFLLKGGSVVCREEKCPPVKCTNPIVDPHVCCPICKGKHSCACTGAAEHKDTLFLISSQPVCWMRLNMQKVPRGTRTVPAPSAPVLTERPSVQPHAAAPPTACTRLKPLVRPGWEWLSCFYHRVITLLLYWP